MMSRNSARIFIAISFVSLVAWAPALAGPDLQIDTQESVILIPQGTVSSNTLEISNDGDSTLTWTLCDSFKGKVVRDFENPWTSAYSMRYDATRDCLWLAYYYSSELKKVSTSNGSVLATKNMGSNCTRPYAIEMDGAFLWAPDYVNTRFVKSNLDNMSVAATVPFPSGWTYCYGLGIGDGKMFATRYNYDYRKNIYRLNPSSGAVAQTFSNVEYFYYSGNHIGYGDGGVWFGAYYKPKNVIKKFDPALGKVRSEIEMPNWDTTYCSIRDQSLTGDGRIWALTYRHDYHETSENKYWIHLLDVGAMQHLTESADSGSVAATSSVPVGVVFDGTSADSGIHRVGIRISSNGGTKEKPYVFVVHAPGANSAPTADAGADQTHDITEPTMEVTLNGTGSTDPNGDELVYEWFMVDGSMVDGKSPTVVLGPGVHDIKLTVSDLRGGTDTDTVRITLRAPDIEVDDLYVPIPEGGGTANGTVTVRNSGDRTLDWSVSDTLQLDQSAIVREFEVSWVSSYSTYAYPYTMTYDATRDCLWVGYYYDDEVGKINASNGSIITTKSVGAGRRIYALDMEGADLWTADYYEKKFRKYNPDTMANTQTIDSPWGTSYGPCSLARDSGQFYASQYYGYDICKLNAGSGAVEATHNVNERQYYYNHHDAIDGQLWYTRYNTPRTRIHSIDGTSGSLLCTLDMGHWNENGQIYDLSFVNSTQCWMLTYNVKSDGKRWAHLVDLSAGARFSKDAVSGIVSAGAAATFDVSYDTTGLAKGLYPVLLTLASNDPDEPVYEKEIYFLVHEDAPNNPPVADAGPDITRETLGVAAPFILNNLSGEGSSDPDGDPLKMSWSWTDTGEPLVLSENGVIELAGGSYGLTLTVEDYRGGVDTDEMVFTVNAGALRRDSPQYNGPNSDNSHVAEDWLENWPPIERWRVNTRSGYGHAVVLDGRMYTWGHGPRCFDLKTGEQIWLGDVNSYPKGDPGNTYTTFAKVWPVVDEVHVYTVDGGGVLCAWERDTGELVWYNKGPNNTYIPSPYVDGDLVFGDYGACNKFTGEKVWTYSTGWGCPYGFDYEGRRWLQLNGYMYNMATGEKGSHLAYPDGYSMAPTLFDGNKWFDIQSVRVMGGSTLWTVPSNKDKGYMTQYTRPAIVDGYAYFPHCHDYRGGAGPLKCVRLTDGQLMWNGPMTIGASAADGLLVFSAKGGINVIKHDPTHMNHEGREIFNIDGLGVGGYGVQPFVVGKRIYAKCGGWMVCLDCAFSAPVVNNYPGAKWHSKTASASLRGKLVNTGGKPAEVHVYWGTSDGGTNTGDWHACVSVGPTERGPFSAQIPGLETNAVYYYRSCAVNEIGATWAPSTKRFTTPVPGTVDVTSGLFVHWPCDELEAWSVPDVTGNGNHGFMSRGCIGTNGVIAGAASTGPAGWHTLGGLQCEPLSERIRDDFTVAAWIKCGGVGGPWVKLWYDLDTGNGKGFGSPDFSNSKANEWQHIVALQRDGMRRLYRDGVCARVYDPGAGAGDTFGGLTIDRGVIFDDLRVYSRALSDAEIGVLWAMGAGEASGWASVDGDDAEESDDGSVCLDGLELNLGQTADGRATLAGLRFPALAVPRGATILSADIRFRAGGCSNRKEVVLSDVQLGGYGGVNDGTAVIRDGGRTLSLAGNICRAHPFPYTVGSDTILEFDFSSSVEMGTMHGIGLEDQTNSASYNQIFNLYGAKGGISAGFRDYKPEQGVRHYRIPIGQYYTGPMTHVVSVNRDTTAPLAADSMFSNIVLYDTGAWVSNPVSLWIGSEVADDAAAFTSAARDLSARPVTEAKVLWLPGAWLPGDSGPAQKTPDLAAIVQPIVDREGWTSGNALAFLVAGVGGRTVLAGERGATAKPVLSVTWTEDPDLDRDGIPDTWERVAANAPASEQAPGGDADGDGVLNYEEYFMGDAAADSGEEPLLSLETRPNGKVVACVNARATDPFYFPGMNRYYTLMHREALPTSGGTTETLWHEDFNLPDGTTNDTGESAWTLWDDTGNPCVRSGRFSFKGRMSSHATWRSEWIDIGWKRVDVSLDIRSESVKDGDISVRYAVNGGSEQELVRHTGGFNSNAVETVRIRGLVCETLRLVVRAKAYNSHNLGYTVDNVKVTHTVGPEWPAVPGVSNVLVTTDRMIEHTNDTPAKTGFYRLKTRLE